jgi:hypothetical protein
MAKRAPLPERPTGPKTEELAGKWLAVFTREALEEVETKFGKSDAVEVHVREILPIRRGRHHRRGPVVLAGPSRHVQDVGERVDRLQDREAAR